jgi:diadenosine tetraphosphate (Ap4A) HIT family hydrolase
MPCVFCDIGPDRIEWEDDLVFAIRDAFPVTEGHTLLIPKRHVSSWFDATEAEQLALVRGLERAKSNLDLAGAPDGYNIGINAGAAAGQTVMHLHVHLIPRRTGDVDDPRGGVRHTIPGKGNYLGGTNG